MVAKIPRSISREIARPQWRRSFGRQRVEFVEHGLPKYKQNVEVAHSDDGESIDYLFGCIKMLLPIFEYAKSHRMCVIHNIEKLVD